MKRFSHWARALLLAGMALLLVMPLAALADNVVADGDLARTGVQDVYLGDICPGETKTASVAVFITRQGSGNVYANGAVVTISGPTTGALTATGGSITLPSNWTGQGNGAVSNVLTSTVSLSASPGDPGTYEATISYEATGSEYGGGQLTRTANLKVHWTIPAGCDTKAPATTITLEPGQPDGNNGWYRSNVHATVSAVDEGGSGVAEVRCVLDPATVPASFDAIPAGCAYGGSGADVTTDGQHTLYAASKDVAGNKSSVVSASFKIDKTAPTLTWGTATPAANAAGWNNTDVSVPFTPGDDTSGVASTSLTSPLVLSTEGEAVTGQVTVTDAAGNSATFTSPSFKIDLTAPTISGAPDREPNAYGWYNADVTVSWTCGDALSGVAACPDPVTLGEGADQSVTRTVTDKAGNTASATVSGINIDKTAPTISGAPDREPNAYGWYNADVTVTWTCGDALSGVATCPETVTLGEGADQSVTGTVTDKAGNSASATVSGINIDKTAPTFGDCPVCGDILLGSTRPLVTITAQDSLSDIDQSASTLTGEVDTSSVGPKDLTFTAIDKAGNWATKKCTYSVIYNWSGFFRPVDNPPVVNRVKAGSAVPIKFSLAGDQGLNIFASGYPASFAMTVGWGAKIDDISLAETVFAGNSGLTYDPLADQYVYVWKTDKSWAGTSREFVIRLIDGTYHRAYFTFTK